MAIIFCDDFKGFGTSTAFMLDGLYASVGGGTSLFEDPDPNVTGTVLRAFTNAASGTRLRRVFLSGAHDVIGIAARVWLAGLPSSDGESLALVLSNTSNTAQVWLSFSTTGQIIIRKADYTAIATTTLPVVTSNAWNHIEAKFTADTSGGGADNGAVEVRVNGTTVLTATGLTSGQSYAQFRIDCHSDVSNGHTMYFKDLILWDTTGTTENNFFGSVTVFGRTTVSDVSFNWTAASGSTGYNMMDNSPPVDATQYIAAGTPPPAASVFGLTPLPADVTSIRGMVTQIRTRKTDGGDGTIQAGLISNGDTGLGTDRPITTAFTYYEDIFPLDPDTGLSWSVAAANAATLRLNRTT